MENKKVYQIAIDGPSGVGKSSIARDISKKLGFVYINTGAMYRCYSLALINNNVSIEDIDQVMKTLKSNRVELIGESVFLNGKDVTDLVIPSNYNYKGQDYKIVQINYKIFAYCSSLISVTIPDGITEIDCYTFEGCYNLANVIIPNTVTEIEYEAFYNGSSLTDINIPDSIIKISEESFKNCSSLENLVIPNSVNIIGENAFENVPHIEYHGMATGAPWGAMSMN